MKKFILGFLVAITFTAIASVQSGKIISADLINAILNIPVSTGENTCGAVFTYSSGISNYVVDHSSCPNTVTLTTTNVDGNLDLDYSGMGLSHTPAVTVTAYHHGGVSAFATATFRSSPTNTGSEFYLASGSGGYTPTYFHVSIERMSSDRYARKTIKTIILELFPNIFDNQN